MFQMVTVPSYVTVLLFEVPVNWLPVRDQWIGDILRDIAARGRQRA